MASTEVAAETRGHTQREASDLSARLVGLGLHSNPSPELCSAADVHVTGASTPITSSAVPGDFSDSQISFVVDTALAVAKAKPQRPLELKLEAYSDASELLMATPSPPPPLRDASTSPSPGHPLRRYSSNLDSTPSIKSLRDIPCVDQTLDSAFVSDRYSFRSAPYNSTPFRSSNPDQVRASVHSVTSQTNAKSLTRESLVAIVPSSAAESVLDEPAQDNEPQPADGTSISKLQAKLSDLTNRTESWTSVTMAAVISACELGRQAQTLANTISGFGPLASADPAAFANQYHQLRGIYASIGDQASSATSGASGASGSTSASPSPPPNNSQLSWEHHQLVDSFITLLRTSPGFIASAYSRLGNQAASQFCSSGESSTLSLIFYNVLGCAPQTRAAFFAEIIDTLWYIERPTNSVQNRLLLVQSILDRLLMSSLGTISKDVYRILHRFLIQFLKGSRPDFKPLFRRLLPDGFLNFVSWLPEGTEETVAQSVQDFLSNLLLSPYRWGAFADVYLSEKARQQLSDFAEVSRHEVQTALIGKKDELADAIGHIWEPETLVVLKGSEIISLYHSLLPTPASMDDGLDEWCLDNIRSDLLPVIREMMHVPGHSTSWQVFKLGSDGLAADLRGELVSTGSANAGSIDSDRPLELLADKFRPGMATSEAIELVLEDAEMTGDHLVQYSLLNMISDDTLAEQCAQHLRRKLQMLQSRETAVTGILTTATKLRFAYSNRLRSLLDGLDMCRIHVWYEHEVRLGTPFMKTRELLNGLFPDGENEQSGGGTIGPFSGGTISGGTQTATLRSRRLSILSSHYHAEPVLVGKEYLQKPKLVDREVEATLLYMRRCRIRNFCRAEELIHRAHCDVAQLAKKVVEKDVLAGTMSFKRDLHPHVHGHHHRRSSLGLFDIFDSAPPPPTTAPLSGVPTALQVVTLVLSDIGRKFIDKRTETDEFMRQTGQMLLEGDGHAYQPLLDDISSEISPEQKLYGFNNVVRLATLRLQSKLSAGVTPSRADITHELAKSLGREGGTLFGDLQTVAAYIPSSELPQAFDDLSEAALSVLDNVVARSSDVADRILRYHIESTSFSQAPLVANMGIADSVAIWAFCARHGRPDARTRLAELYKRYPHTSLQVKPFSRPSLIFDGVEPSNVREAVITHWLRR